MEVAKCLSFSKAASHMFVSQPAVSKQVALLEQSLSLTLIHRTPTGIQLTEAGKLFYRFFQKYYADFQTIWDTARRLSTQESGTIRLGCLDGWDMSAFFPQLRDLVKQKYPELKISLDGYNHITVLDALRDGAIDIGITLEITVKNQPDLTLRRVTSAPAVILFSGQNPLAQKKDLALTDFRDDPFFVISPTVGGDNPMEQLAIDVCQQAGFTPKIEYVPSSAAILMRLQSGTGVQVTCAWTGACRMPLFHIIPLDHILNISAVWLDNGVLQMKNRFIDEVCTQYSALETSHPLRPWE